MKRSAPLRTEKPLARRKPLEATAAPKRKPEAPEVRAFRVAIRKRCKGVCEARTEVCWGVVDPLMIDPHHIGGRVGPFAHDPNANGLGVCRACHDWIGRNPERAYELRLMARRNQVDNPAMTGVPFWTERRAS